MSSQRVCHMSRSTIVHRRSLAMSVKPNCSSLIANPALILLFEPVTP